MRGVALPVSAIVIIVMSMVVMLSATTLYFTGSTPFTSTVSPEAAKNTACMKLLSYNCEKNTKDISTEGFDANSNGKIDDNLFILCSNYYGTCKNPTFNSADTNDDCVVDNSDFDLLTKKWGSKSTDPDWDPDADPNGDDQVDVTDVLFIKAPSNWDTYDNDAEKACKRICQCPQ